MLTYSLDERGEDSLYGYLYQCIRRDIEAGILSADEKLPSKRALAKHLGVSLITVEGAYTQLMAEGYVRSEPRRGYFVNALVGVGTHAAILRGVKEQDRRSASGEHVDNRFEGGAGNVEHQCCERSGGRLVESGEFEQVPLVANLTGGSMATKLFPSTLWAKTLRDMLSREPERELLCESPSMGMWRLREVIAAHLREFRGLEVQPNQIVVGSGAQTLYGLIVQLLGRANHFAVEDPGYTRLTKIYESNDVRLIHVPLDAHGINMQVLRAMRANVVHLMPSHQFPTGLVTPISRRYELLGWATDEPGRYIVEDDYDCEFRLTGRPIPTMMSIDAAQCVIYANTFSRSLGPAFRIAYLVLPLHLAERFQQDLGFYSCTVSTMEQLVLARFIENGDFERHVNRMRSHYRNMRDELVDALGASPLRSRITIEGADAGLHFLLCLDAGVSERSLVTAAYREGVEVRALSSFYQQRAQKPHKGAVHAPKRSPAQRAASQKSEQCHFLINYAGLDRDAITPAVQALVRAWSSIS